MNNWIDRNGGHLIVLLLSFILNGALVLILLHPFQPALQVTVPTPSPTPGRVRVYVSGAVTVPDVYDLPVGSVVKDALRAAGGGTADADLSVINLAQEIKDQTQVNIPMRARAIPPADGSPEQAAQPVQPSPALLTPQARQSKGSEASGPVNLNTAGAAELETLPGIGPVLAQRIIDYRTQNGPFASIEALKEVQGIGDLTFERLKGRIVVQ
jgi:competence protein ComEA